MAIPHQHVPITCTIYDQKDTQMTPEEALHITMKKFLPPNEYTIWLHYKKPEEDAKTRVCTICHNTTQKCILKNYGIPIWTKTALEDIKKYGTYVGEGSTWETIVNNL